MTMHDPEILEIDAAIHCIKEWNGSEYQLKGARWLGGRTAGISDSLMRDFNPSAQVGQQ